MFPDLSVVASSSEYLVLKVFSSAIARMPRMLAALYHKPCAVSFERREVSGTSIYLVECPCYLFSGEFVSSLEYPDDSGLQDSNDCK
jgi:hypothetical protein